MIFANVRELKQETGRLLERSRKEGPVMVTKRGKPVAILRGITEDQSALLSHREVLNTIREAAEKAGYGPKDVDRLVREVRRI